MPVLPLDERSENEEVDLGHDDEDTNVNAWRCYLCNYKFEIDQDACIHCDWCIKVSPRACIHKLTRLFRDEDGAPTGKHQDGQRREKPPTSGSTATSASAAVPACASVP